MTAFCAAVARVLDALQPGQVVTYGEVAREAGFPGAARAVGTFLRDSRGYPWWRVVRSDGRLLADREAEQSRRLRAEGIVVEAGRVAPDPPTQLTPDPPAQLTPDPPTQLRSAAAGPRPRGAAPARRARGA